VGESGSEEKDRDGKEMAQTMKRTAEMRKQMVKMQKQMVKTWKTAVVNKKTEGESLYQNRRNTHQTDGRTILYNL
jgi:hypothetical protein